MGNININNKTAEEILSDQQPSTRFSKLMDYYNQARQNLNNNPSSQNQTYFNSISGLIKDISVHNSTFSGTGKLYNYSIGSERGIFYPNDKYLNNSSRLMANNDLTTNLTNDLNNNTGIIYANNNLNLNVNNNLNNNRKSSILALKNIAIKSAVAGSDNLFKLNQFNNTSATLQSYEGNIAINAKDFVSNRDASDLEVVIDGGLD